ncbi:MAG: PKD domain-containing protein [Bacteroidales bacterium]
MLFRYFISRFVFLIAFMHLVLHNNAYTQPDFKIDRPDHCAPAVVHFHNLSVLQSGYYFLWDLGNNQLIDNQESSLSEVYSEPGTYTVTLYKTNGIDTNSVQKEFTLNASPRAAFSISSTEGCMPLVTRFSDISEPGDAKIIKRTWDVRTGEEFSDSSFMYSYEIPGKYGVLLRVTDVNGCSDHVETADNITVHPIPEPAFTAVKNSACNAPLTVTFINNTVGEGIEFHWNFGNGNVSSEQFPTSVYTTGGMYDVSLEATGPGGCSAKETKKDYIKVGKISPQISVTHDSAIFPFETDTFCPGTLDFRITGSEGDDNIWILDNHDPVKTNNFTITFSDSGHHELTLVAGYTSACPDTQSNRFFVDYLEADFLLNDSVFCQFPVILSPVSQSINQTQINWILPSGKESEKNEPFDTLFLPENIDPYDHIPFVKDYGIILQAYNQNGCKDEALKNIKVTLPLSRFVPDTTSGCIPLEVSFADSSRSEIPLLNNRWFINKNLIGENVSGFKFSFLEEGVHEVFLVSENSAGCIDTSYSVFIKTGKTAPIEIFTSPLSACFGDSITIAATSAIEDSVDYWHFFSPGVFTGNPALSAEISTPVYPEKPGFAPVYASMEYNGCISDTVLEDYLYLKGPAGSFRDSFTCENPFDYHFISRVEQGSSLTWQVEDSVLNNKNDTVRYVFPSSGDYDISLTAENDTSGCTWQKSMEVTVRKVNAAFLAPAIACADEPVSFNAGTSEDYITECYMEGFLWDFGDLTPPRRTYLVEKYHVFSEKGNYNVQLVVTAGNGCTDTVNHPITVFKPLASYTIDKDTVCAPDFNINFQADDSDNTIHSYSWFPGDGSIISGNQTQVQHTYYINQRETIYTGLEVKDFSGCKSYLYKPVQVNKPDAGFYTIERLICNGESVRFIPTGDIPDSYKWIFGDGDSSLVSSYHTYIADGMFDVTYSIEKDGCFTSKTRVDYINVETANAKFTVDNNTFTCYPAKLTFMHVDTNSSVISGQWEFAPGQTSQTYRDSMVYSYNKPGIFQPSLEIRTLNGCTDKHTETIEVSGPEGDFFMSKVAACQGELLTFTTQSLSNVESFTWFFGDGKTGTDTVQVHAYNQGGTFVPALQLRDAQGCQILIKKDSVEISNLNTSIYLNKENLCVGDTLYIQNNIFGSVHSTLFLDDSVLVNNARGYTLFANKPGQYNLTLVGEDPVQCRDTSTRPFTVHALPELELMDDTTVCQGEEIMLYALSEEGNIISWFPANYLSDSHSPFPRSSPEVPVSYTVTATNPAGCITSDVMSINIINHPALHTRPTRDTVISIGQRITLSAFTNTNDGVTWQPDYMISCTDCNNPEVRPFKTTSYVVTSENQCFAVSDSITVFVLIDFTLEMPDAFTPNGDGVNDVVHVQGKKINKLIDFKVFNRWGNLVFETTDLNEGWDGTLKGKRLPTDTYTYMIRALTIHDYEVFKKGTILLLD